MRSSLAVYADQNCSPSSLNIERSGMSSSIAGKVSASGQYLGTPRLIRTGWTLSSAPALLAR
jgi:hypothetical protein